MNPPYVPQRPARGPVFGRGCAVLTGWYATMALGAMLWWLSLPAVKSHGSCDGIGYGCTPNARTGTLLILTYVVLPALLVSYVLGVAAVGLLAAARMRSPVTVGTLAMVSGVATVGAVAVVAAGLW